MHRLFAGIRPPSTVRDLLLDAMDDSPDFRWQDDEQLHLTLRFVGAVDRPQAEDLAVALGRVQAAPFALRIAGVGSFDHRNSGALWAGVDPKPPVASLTSKIERACQSIGLAPERRAFHPHITLARWSGRRTRETRAWLEQQAGLQTPPFDVTEFILFESHLSRHGAHYEAVARYSLLSAPATG